MSVPIDRIVTEKDLDALVRDIARRTGWTRYHTYRSQRSPSGYPDLTLVRASRLLFCELKSERGKPTPDQEKWLDLLRAVTSVEVHLWRPSSIDEIAFILSPRWRDQPPPEIAS